MIAGVNMPMQLHILVSGHVQGVGFRDFARRNAVRFEIRGFTKPLANGDVEIVAEGAKAALDEFIFSLCLLCLYMYQDLSIAFHYYNLLH